MQPSIQFNLSASAQEVLKNSPVAEWPLFLEKAVADHAEQIGYMLQEYYPKEKVRGVAVIASSFNLSNAAAISVLITFTLEEFNACSAVNTEDRKQMPVTLHINEAYTALSLTGEYWPERD